MFGSQEIGSGWVSFGMIFEALQSELLRFPFHSLGPKILKIPGFNLCITYFQINTMDRDFNKEILHLVDMLREVSKRQKSDSVLNLVLKLDFNHYLTKMAAAEA